MRLKHILPTTFILLTLSTALQTTLQARANHKSVLIGLPITLGTPLSLSYNLAGEAAVSLELTWESERELLSKNELEENPNTSLTARSNEVGLSFSRYSNSYNMSGWHWSLGAGYRSTKGIWIKEPLQSEQSQSTDVTLDGNEKAQFQYLAKGVTVNGRVGFRYVAEELGFAASLFFLLKHFQNRVIDDKEHPDFNENNSISYDSSNSLRRKFTTRLSPGIEVGWAF